MVGRNDPHSPETVAFAYELRCEGCDWEFIAIIVGGSSDKIRHAVRRALKNGLKKAP